MNEPYYMSFASIKKGFLGACLVYARDPEDALRQAWTHHCNPGGEVQLLIAEFVPDKKWFYRLLQIPELRDMEAEVNLKYHKDKPILTPRLYS